MGPPCRCSDCSPGTGHSVLDRRQRAVALCFVAAAWACAAAAQSVKGMAPGDQYFGRLKLSFLGINNTFKDSGIRAGAHTVDPDIQTKVDSAIDALNDWQRQFPNDPQLARSYFLAQQTLKKIWVKQYQEKAWAYMQHIVAQYPSTFYGKTIKAEIAKGFTQHYFATAEPCGPDGPQPLPTAAPAVDSGKYKVQIEPAPCYTPKPSPSPSPSPTETPTAPPPQETPLSSPSASGLPAQPPSSPSQPSQPPAASESPAASQSPASLPSPAAPPSPVASPSHPPPSQPSPSSVASPSPLESPSPAAPASPAASPRARPQGRV
jgi:hypothetical protein